MTSIKTQSLPLPLGTEGAVGFHFTESVRVYTPILENHLAGFHHLPVLSFAELFGWIHV